MGREQERGKREKEIYVKRAERDKGGWCAYGRFVNVYVNYSYQTKYNINIFLKSCKLTKE